MSFKDDKRDKTRKSVLIHFTSDEEGVAW